MGHCSYFKSCIKPIGMMETASSNAVSPGNTSCFRRDFGSFLYVPYVAFMFVSRPVILLPQASKDTICSARRPARNHSAGVAQDGLRIICPPSQ